MSNAAFEFGDQFSLEHGSSSGTRDSAVKIALRSTVDCHGVLLDFSQWQGWIVATS